jgi:hypothetical protein
MRGLESLFKDYPEVGGDTFLRNVGLRTIYTKRHPRRRHCSPYRILVGKPEGKRPLEDQDVSGWTLLK